MRGTHGQGQGDHRIARSIPARAGNAHITPGRSRCAAAYAPGRPTGRRFGFKKGSKSDLFVAIWEEYKRRLAR